jgi:hypothetical protein
MSYKDELPHNGITRRKVITGGAVVGGLVWAAPAMKTVGKMQGTTGSTPVTTEPSTSPTTEATTTSSSSTTTTTTPQVCDCTTCATVQAGSTTLYFTCAPETQEDCDCLCNCGGLNFPCSKADPCTVTVTCTPTPGNVPC